VPAYCRAAPVPGLGTTARDHTVVRPARLGRPMGVGARKTGVGAGKTVLVVDDDASLRLLCRVNLELDGYRVLEAGSLVEGEASLADAAEIDAVLLDLHLGDGDGRTLLASLVGERPPVALFTGSETIGPELRALAEEVLPKPFTLDALKGTVGRLVGGAREIDSRR
jgi:DNA-binding NtrC family response regulator